MDSFVFGALPLMIIKAHEDNVEQTIKSSHLTFLRSFN